VAFLDSVSSTVDAILTTTGRALLAKNNGSFKIVKFAFGDDDVNYQLYNLNTDSDTDILNLPILEPSSNPDTALRYPLVTLPKGVVSVATLQISTSFIVLGLNRISTLPKNAAITVKTTNGTDSSYSVVSRNSRIARANVTNTTIENDADGGSQAIVVINSANDLTGSTIIDIVGNDTGATITLTVTVQENISDAVN
jgi:hypothetical protein